jgi:hypothetical protein
MLRQSPCWRKDKNRNPWKWRNYGIFKGSFFVRNRDAGEILGGFGDDGFESDGEVEKGCSFAEGI